MFVELVFTASGLLYEAPAWTVEVGDIVSVYENSFHTVKDTLIIDRDSEAYDFVKTLNGGELVRVKAIYHKETVKEAD